MPRYQPKLKNKLEKEISSKDLTKFQLLGYIFSDFLKGGFIVLSLTFDILVLAEPEGFIPSYPIANLNLEHYLNEFQILTVYTIILVLFLEFIAIYFEIRIFNKFWGSKVVPWYYGIKKEK